MRPTTSLSLSSDLVFDALVGYPTVYVVYRWLERQVGRDHVDPSNKAIAQALVMSDSTVQRALKVLEQLGLITITYLTKNRTKRALVVDFRWRKPVVQALQLLARGELSINIERAEVIGECPQLVTAPVLPANENPAVTKSGHISGGQPELFASGGPQVVDESASQVLVELPVSSNNYLGRVSTSIRVKSSTNCLNLDLKGEVTLATLVGRYLLGEKEPLVSVARPVLLKIDADDELLASIETVRDDSAAIESIFEHWKTKTGQSRHLLTANLRRKIAARLKKFSKELLLEAIDAIAASDYHMGRNDSGKFYGDLDRNFRSDDKVQWWLARPQVARKADARALEHSVGNTAPKTGERF